MPKKVTVNYERSKRTILIVVLLHFVLFFYSSSGIFSKLASNEAFFSLRFCACYLSIIAILGMYAILWQQVIKRLPLSVAFANKAVIVVWGMLWGRLFFGEQITAQKIIGAVIVILGVVLYSLEKTNDKA